MSQSSTDNGTYNVSGVLDQAGRRLLEIARASGLRCTRTVALLSKSHERLESAQRALAIARRIPNGWDDSPESFGSADARLAALRAEVAVLVQLHQISTRFLRDGDVGTALSETLAAVMWVTGTELGNVQLVNPDTGALEIVTHHGFGPGFLGFFAQVHTEGAACGVAMRDRRRIIVPDVITHPIFAGRPAQQVLLRA